MSRVKVVVLDDDGRQMEHGWVFLVDGESAKATAQKAIVLVAGSIEAGQGWPAELMEAPPAPAWKMISDGKVRGTGATFFRVVSTLTAKDHEEGGKTHWPLIEAETILDRLNSE